MSNPLIDWEAYSVYLTEVKNIKFGPETQKQMDQQEKDNG